VVSKIDLKPRGSTFDGEAPEAKDRNNAAGVSRVAFPCGKTPAPDGTADLRKMRFWQEYTQIPAEIASLAGSLKKLAARRLAENHPRPPAR